MRTPDGRTGFGARTLIVAACIAAGGCLGSVSEIQDRYGESLARTAPALEEPADVAIFVEHLEQQHGWDSVPKRRPPAVGADFDEILRDALRSLENLGTFSISTVRGLEPGPGTPSSGVLVGVPVQQAPSATPSTGDSAEFSFRRAVPEDRDFALYVTMFRESSFAAHAVCAFLSTATAWTVPIPFRWQHSARVDVLDREGRVRSFSRSALVSGWFGWPLLVAYPYYPLAGRQEELHRELLRDLFREIDDRGVLRTPSVGERER